MKQRKTNGQFTRRDPPLPPLDKPDPVLFYDLSPEDQAKAEIYLINDQTRKWRFKNGQSSSSL